MELLGLLRDPIERPLLKRWYAAPRMKATRLDLELDLSNPTNPVRATAELAFRPQLTTRTLVCGMGDVRMHSATWDGRTVKARVNAPYLVLRFPEKVQAFTETAIRLKYTYRPDQYGTIRQPLTRHDFSMELRLTCRRPLLAVSQGHLVEGREEPPFRTYRWAPPRCRRLNAVVADVRSFKKAAPSGMNVWLHAHADAVARAPRLLDHLIDMIQEAEQAHHRQLPYADYHVVESDDAGLVPFASPGLIVVPRGTFRRDDRPYVTGVVAPELNKEWGRDALRLQQRSSAKG